MICIKEIEEIFFEVIKRESLKPNPERRMKKMLYEDKFGKLWHPDDVEALSEYEIQELGFHICSCKYGEV